MKTATLETVVKQIQRGNEKDARDIMKGDDFKAELRASLSGYLKKLPREEKLLKRDQYEKEIDELTKSSWAKAFSPTTTAPSKDKIKESSKEYRNKLGLTGFFIATASAFVPVAMKEHQEEFVGAVEENLREDFLSGSHDDDLQKYLIWAQENQEVAAERVVEMTERILNAGELLGDVLPVLMPTIAFYGTIRRGGNVRDAIYNAAQSAFYGVVGKEIALLILNNTPGAVDFAARLAYQPAFEILKADMVNDVGSDIPIVAGASEEEAFPWEQDTAWDSQDVACTDGVLQREQDTTWDSRYVAGTGGDIESGAQFGDPGLGESGDVECEDCGDVELLCCLWEIITIPIQLIMLLVECLFQIFCCFL